MWEDVGEADNGEQDGTGWIWGTQATSYFVTELDLGPVSFDVQPGAFFLAPPSSYSGRFRYTEAEVHPSSQDTGDHQGRRSEAGGGGCVHTQPTGSPVLYSELPVSFNAFITEGMQRRPMSLCVQCLCFPQQAAVAE